MIWKMADDYEVSWALLVDRFDVRSSKSDSIYVDTLLGVLSS